MKFVSNLFFTDIDFCKPNDIQVLDLNFNLYFLTLLRGTEVFNSILILFKNFLLELSAFSSSIFNKSSQSREKYEDIYIKLQSQRQLSFILMMDHSALNQKQI